MCRGVAHAVKEVLWEPWEGERLVPGGQVAPNGFLEAEAFRQPWRMSEIWQDREPLKRPF